MDKPIVLRNVGDINVVAGIAMSIYYSVNDWLETTEFVDRLVQEYERQGKSTDNTSGGQGVAKMKPALYYGLIEYKKEGGKNYHRLTAEGRKFYEAYINQDEDTMVDLILNLLATTSFGSNNTAVSNSNSPIDPPKVFILTSLVLNGVTKDEYAYSLQELTTGKSFENIIKDIMICRLISHDVELTSYSRNNYKDDKGLLFLCQTGLTEDKTINSPIKKKYVEKYSELFRSISVIGNGDNILMPSYKPLPICKDLNISTNYFDALCTKPFLLLAGISGTGKSRIVREMAFKSCPSYLRDKDGTTPGNYCMIEVKPNWHDSSELLGYYSNISKKYIFTKFVKFLVKAKLHPSVPFFVCLDEMNLAPVEQYFAEFLSVLETRKLIKDEDGNCHVVSGNLIKPESFIVTEITKVGDKEVEHKKFLTDRQWFYEFFGETELADTEREIVDVHTDFTLKEKGLALPENVFIVGTVNMDDTTHQFSRKVIDRAMTIEMNGGNLEDMFGGSSDLEYPTEPDDKILSMATLKAKYVSADDVLDKCERIKSNEEVLRFVVGKDAEGNILENEDTLPNRLNAINKILKNTPFQISYRVFNELVIYLAVLCDDPNNADKDVINDLAPMALDQIVLMKILPRIEGDYDMFNTSEDKNKLEQLQELFAAESSSWKKLDEMNKRLVTTEFTRFWP